MAPAARQRSPLQQGVGPPSIMAVVVFAALAFLLLFKAYDSFIAPHASIARAVRVANGTQPFEPPSNLTLRQLPDVGPRDTPEWRALQKTLVKEVRKADAGAGFQYLLYGDSITESWRGTEMGGDCRRCAGCGKAFKRIYGRYRTGVLAISGDTTGHLLWRLNHGEMPSARHQPRAAVLLIGTNDLGLVAKNGGDPTDGAPEAVIRLTAIVGLLRGRLPQTHVLLAAVLPRGWKKGPEDERFLWPNSFSEGIQFINDHMRAAADGEANVTFVDCNGLFVADGRVIEALMPDALHPNAKGMDLLARCYNTELRRLGLM